MSTTKIISAFSVTTQGDRKKVNSLLLVSKMIYTLLKNSHFVSKFAYQSTLL